MSGWTERWDCEDVTDGGSEGKERAPLHMKKIVIKNTKKEYFLELMPLHIYTTMLLMFYSYPLSVVALVA